MSHYVDVARDRLTGERDLIEAQHKMVNEARQAAYDTKLLLQKPGVGSDPILSKQIFDLVHAQEDYAKTLNDKYYGLAADFIRTNKDAEKYNPEVLPGIETNTIHNKLDYLPKNMHTGKNVYTGTRFIQMNDTAA
jgi:hypothetical protein